MTPESADSHTHDPASSSELLALPFLCIPRMLFLNAQFRITDLIFMVAVLGNAEGLLLTMLDGLSALIPCIWVGVLILGGATWGLWIATHLGELRVLRRWGLMLLGILLPFAIIGTPVGLVLTMIGAGMGQQGWQQVLIGYALFLTCGYLACESLVLHRRAQDAENAAMSREDSVEPSDD